MSDHRDEIARILADAERAAYQRGWNEALLSVALAAKQMANSNIAPDAAKASPHVEPPARPGRPASNTVKIVGDIITENPGMTGVDIVKAAQAIDNTVKERTARTALRRLRLAKVIWKRSGLWYPKAKEKTAAENGNGEAVGSPPH